MAFISCKVIDSPSNRGVGNVSAILQYKDNSDHTIAQFRAISDSSGAIYNWAPLTDLMTDLSGPEDIVSPSTISLTFMPPNRLPWVRIRAEADVTGTVPVHFTLSLEKAGYSLQYAYCAVDLSVRGRSQDCEMMDVGGAIPPLSLPPSLMSDAPHQRQTNSRKRKRSLSD